MCFPIFAKFGKFSAIIFLSTFSEPSIFSSLRFWWQECQILVIISWVPEKFCSFFLLWSLFSPLLRFIISIFFSSSSWIPFFDLFILLLGPIKFFILLLYFWLLKFSLVSSLYLLFSEIFYFFFILSNMCIIACHSTYIMAALKSLSDIATDVTSQGWCLLILSSLF